MKYLKKFEDLQEVPKVGDYVLIITDSSNEHFKEFINNTIGVLEHIIKHKPDIWGNESEDSVSIKYENVPPMIKDMFYLSPFITKDYGRQGFREFDIKKIVAFAKTKEELEIKLSANKYNL